MNWNDLAKEVHRDAVDKGWWDKSVTIDDVVCMCICELAEAVEEYRNGRPNYYHLCQPSRDKRLPCNWDLQRSCPLSTGELTCEHRDTKPRGVAVELADCVLRLLDYLATTEVDLSDIHPVKSGADGPFTSFLSDVVIHLVSARIDHANDEAKSGCDSLKFFIGRIIGRTAINSIDLESILLAKHEYNKTRPYRHGWKLV